MATEYTSDEIITKVKAIDVELEKLLLSTATSGPSLRTPLQYSIGEKSINLTSRVEALLKLRKTYVDSLKALGGGVNEDMIPPDYEMDSLGEQLGDVVTGTE